MGVALTPCTVPAAGRPSFSLGDDEIELGLGIHGEPGVRREPLEPADDLVDHLINAILGDAPPAPGERVALLINNLGATPTMELLIVARCALATLESLGVQVERVYLGTFLSALEMAGVSLSVLRVDDARLARLDAATEAPAWPNAANRQRVPQAGGIQRGKAKKKPRSASEPPRTELGRALEHTILAAMVALIDAEPTLTELDRIVGDGDLGLSLERGARAVREALGTSSYPLDDPSATLQALGLTLQKALGGTSGALYALLFLRASARLRNLAPTDPKSWTDAFRAGTDAIGELGGSRLGDRTMLDALLPALEALEASLDASDTPTEALDAAAEAAEAGSEATARMSPRRGRSSYLGDRVLGHPDPGAVAVAVWLRAVASAL